MDPNELPGAPDWRAALQEIHPGLASAPLTVHLGGVLESHGRLLEAHYLYEAIVAREPEPVDALNRLASLAQRRGEPDEARMYRERALRIELAGATQDDDDREAIVQFRLAAQHGRDVPKRAPTSFVTTHFDRYAEQFERHLVRELAYRGHLEIARALEETMGPARAELDVLDLGCGTGLVGQAVAPWAHALVGVDLSPKMIARARRKKVYTELRTLELHDALRRSTCTYDVITAGDVLTYVGDLTELFSSLPRVLRPGGIALFVGELDLHGSTFALGPARRYRHAIGYVTRLAARSGLRVERVEHVHMRKQEGEWTPSILWGVRHD